MNANDLWSGSDYAYHDYRQKGVVFQSGGIRVKVIGVTKRKVDSYSERMSAFARVYVLNDNGTSKLRRDGSAIEMEVRARDISMRWEDYAAERNHRANEAAKIAAEVETRKAKERERVSNILDALETRGISRTDVSVSDYGKNVTFSWTTLERWLGLDAS